MARGKTDWLWTGLADREEIKSLEYDVVWLEEVKTMDHKQIDRVTNACLHDPLLRPDRPPSLRAELLGGASIIPCVLSEIPEGVFVVPRDVWDDWFWRKWR